ncbi:MAG: AzlC family protein [Clostridia bacterium 62_21]|nr:MAG: AzlC family protein [Clostridia bacterium 62_21]
MSTRVASRLPSSVTPWRELILGVGKAIPILLGYVPIGIAYGVLAREAGLDLFTVMAMSVMVFAGASQFIAAGMFGAAAGGWSIVVTTLLVNLRHLLFSSSLAPRMARFSTRTLALIGTGITDETFAVASAEPAAQPHHPWFYYGLNLTAYAGWNLGSFLGAVLGPLLQRVADLPLDFALAAMFIYLLVIQVAGRALAATAVLAGVLSVVFAAGLHTKWNVVLAALIAATIGAGWEHWTKRSG